MKVFTENEILDLELAGYEQEVIINLQYVTEENKADRAERIGDLAERLSKAADELMALVARCEEMTTSLPDDRRATQQRTTSRLREQRVEIDSVASDLERMGIAMKM